MMPTRAVLILLAATAWLTLFVVGRPAPTSPDEASARAVTALTSGSVERAQAALPEGFAHDLGYRPQVREQALVNPTGSCSSPVPLPAEFDTACRRHDLGYDLLRHAEHRGGALPATARRALDAQFTATAVDSCAGRDGFSRTWCTGWAEVAGFFVRANSVRQHDSVPSREDALSWATGAAGVLALVGVGSALLRVGRRLTRRLPLPRVSGAAAVTVGFVLSVSPTHLPHGPLLQGGLTATVIGLTWLVGRALRPRVARWEGPARARGLALVGVLGLLALAWAWLSLSAQRTDIGLSATGWGYWATVAGVVLAGHALLRGLRWLWRRRRVAWRPALATGIAATALLSGGPVHGAAAASEEQVLQADSPVGAVRAYGEIRPGEDVAARADRAADELVDRGGLEREHVVIAVPTGSGWVNPNLVSGLERRFGSEVAVVAVQYDSLPSWVAYLLHRDEAADGAREIFDAVTERVAELPEAERPQVHVAGESLGATAGQAIFTGPKGADAADRVCSVLWAGTPGGHRVGLPRETDVANPDDPIVHASPREALLPPGDDASWVPLVGAIHDAADFVGALEVPDGSGHRYGPGQADLLATCGR